MVSGGKHRKIGTKFSILAGILLCFNTLAVLLVCGIIFQNLFMEILEKDCVNGTNLLNYELSKEGTAEDQTEMLDVLKAQTGYEYTIFQGDKRIATTIVQNGSRAVGTALDPAIAKIVLEEGHSYVGETSILGVPHVCSYVPTLGEDGKIDGLIFSGVSSHEAKSNMYRALWIMGSIGICLAAVGVLLIYVFTKRLISEPLTKLTLFARTVEQGDLGILSDHVQTAGISSGDEIGTLAYVFDITVKRLKDYIGELSEILGAVSNNDLTVETRLDYIGDFESIRKSLNNITEKLNSTLNGVVQTSEQVSDGADIVASGAQNLSQGATEEAESVEKLVSTLEIISEEIGHMAENAGEASRKSLSAVNELEAGKHQMKQMVDSMMEINNTSNEIGKIIKVIEDIAFQTNILAINAAIEASRAGDAGKGFAVVAEEVRALAGKSSEASKDTAGLIENCIRAVKKGSEVVSETAGTLERGVASSNQATELVREISTASSEQSKHIEILKGGMNQISSVIQSTSATAEQSAAASETLSAQAQVLKKTVDQFHLKVKVN